MRLNFAQIKNTIGQPINLCADSPDLLSMFNQATETLWPITVFPGKVRWYSVALTPDACNNTLCVVWPRRIETVEKIAICSWPIGIRPEWFEFSENGMGIMTNDTCDRLLLDRGEVCVINDIPGTTSKIKVIPNVTEAAGIQILVQGYDENGDWIRTQVSGTWVDGEYIDINIAAPATSVNYFTKVTSVIKPLTNGNIKMYSIEDTTLTTVLLGDYEPDELTPTYRKSILTGVAPNGCDRIDALVSCRFIPIQGNDNDPVLPACIPALQTMLIAISKLQIGNIDDYQKYYQIAVKLLLEHAKQYRGDGSYKGVDFVGRASWATHRNLQ